ncbi:MAG TPA: DUF4347 domain-containing protein, partial [Nitrospiraceae bacterium]|nr:DUF4347 domain-containing protein [Nitrospiraceae bacterium]
MRILRRPKKAEVKPPQRHRLVSADAHVTRSTFGGSLLALESRIMFDGAAVATVSTVTAEQAAQKQTDTSSAPDDATAADATTPDATSDPSAPTGEPKFATDDKALFDALAVYDASTARQEVVFLSPSVLDYQKLLDGMSPNVEVHVLDPTRDGVEQMAEILAGRTNIDAIHLIGDGTEAEMYLGASFLTQDSISTQYAEQFQQIGQSLSANADLLIYGCDFGRGEAGQAAIQTLAVLTGADIAASTDRTGHVAEYANWQFEATTGFIETTVVIGASTQAEWEHALATFTVTTTNDVVNAGDGVTSLREAIIAANAAAGTDTINFNIGGAGVKTINLTSALPTITGRVTIDGYTETGASVNTLATGNDAVLLIELNGAGAGAAAGLVLGAGSDGSTIRGLIINRFGADGIQINSTGNTIVGNWIGVDPTGTLDRGNAVDGIVISANNNIIGTSSAADRNVLSGNNDEGVDVDPGITGTVIRGNYIGTNAAGTGVVGNGTAALADGGVRIDGSNNVVGGTGAGEGNLIRGNVGPGVVINGGAGNAVLGNSIYENATIGIDLNEDGVTANDAGDGDAGANNLQNFPVLTSAQVVSSTQLQVIGTLNSTANSQFRIEFFSNAAQDGTGYGEGQTYLGFVNVNTNVAGNANFNTTLAASVPAGSFISATATRSNATFTTFSETSEFGADGVAANTAPVLNAVPSPVLTAINEDAGAPSGAVGTLVSNLVDLPGGGGLNNVTDPDSGALVGIAVTAADTTNGTWFYSTNNGASWNALGAVATNSARLLAADANTRLYFQPNANYNGTLPAAITFRAWDRTIGANGGLADTTTNGGITAFSTATDTASLTVNPVNDAPVVDLNAAGAGQDVTTAFTEQTPVLIAPVGTLIDVDSASLNRLRVTLTARPDGNAVESLSLNAAATAAASGAGLTVTYTPASGLLSITGPATTAVYQSILQGIQYNNTSNTPTTSDRSITVVARDSANLSSATQTVTLTVAAVNDAPTATITPLTYSATEQTSLTLHGTGLSVADVDAGAASITATVSVTSGTLSAAAGTTGVTVAGSGTAIVTLTGTLAQINNLLAGNLTGTLTYLNSSDTPPPSATLTLSLNDGGNTGSGGTLVGSDTATINLTAVDDAPVNTVPGAQSTNEDTVLVFSLGNGNLISIGDVDAGGSSVQVTLTGTNGTVTLSGTTGLVFSVGDGTADATMTFTGTAAQINTALAGMSFTPTANFNGAASLQIVTNDLGNTGSGGPLSDTDTVNITVTPVNDAPTATNLSAGETYTEDTALNLTDIVVSDVDSATVTVT